MAELVTIAATGLVQGSGGGCAIEKARAAAWTCHHRTGRVIAAGNEGLA